MNKTSLADLEKVRRKNLGRLIQVRGMEQQDLAKRVGWTASYISQILNGSRPFNEKTARKIEKKLRLAVGVLDTESGKFSLTGTRLTDTTLRDDVKRLIDSALHATGNYKMGKERYAAIVEVIYMDAEAKGGVDAARVGSLVREILKE